MSGRFALQNDDRPPDSDHIPTDEQRVTGVVLIFFAEQHRFPYSFLRFDSRLL